MVAVNYFCMTFSFHRKTLKVIHGEDLENTPSHQPRHYCLQQIEQFQLPVADTGTTKAMCVVSIQSLYLARCHTCMNLVDQISWCTGTTQIILQTVIVRSAQVFEKPANSYKSYLSADEPCLSQAQQRSISLLKQAAKNRVYFRHVL